MALVWGGAFTPHTASTPQVVEKVIQETVVVAQTVEVEKLVERLVQVTVLAPTATPPAGDTDADPYRYSLASYRGRRGRPQRYRPLPQRFKPHFLRVRQTQAH